jgi:hypothetical protein
MARFAAFATVLTLCATPLHAQDISVTRLSQIDTNAVGLITPQSAGLPADFWRDAPASEISRLINSQQHHKIPEARAFLSRLMVTELTPPAEKAGGVSTLVARLDWLLNNGALDAADALLDKAGVTHPALFARWFDVKLMLSRNAQACTPLKLNSALSADLSTKVYCLAQNMDWFSAELTLVLGQNLGAIPPERARLLSYFLDPDLMEEGPALKIQNRSDPLEFTLREALALPRSATGITLSQTHIDLDESAGWLAQLRAGERLARVGAVPARYLDALYSENKASASGGIWDRVRAVANLKSALNQNNPSQICDALNNTWAQMRKASLLHVFSEVFSQTLSTHNLPVECVETQISSILMHPNYGALLFDLIDYIPESSVLRAIATDDFSNAIPQNPIEDSLINAFIQDPPILVTPSLSILKSLGETTAGADSDPRGIERLIGTFRAAGFETEAQRLALQYIILSNAHEH